MPNAYHSAADLKGTAVPESGNASFESADGIVLLEMPSNRPGTDGAAAGAPSNPPERILREDLMRQIGEEMETKLSSAFRSGPRLFVEAIKNFK